MYSGFVNNLITGVYGKGKILLQPFAFKDEEHGLIEIPAGFITDGASIPRFGWSIINVSPFSSTVIYAAVVHDWLYATNQISRRKADKVFYRAMMSQRYLTNFQIKVMYRCVRLFGGAAYKKDVDIDKIIYPDKLKHYINCNG